MDKHDITGAKILVRFLCKNGLRWLTASPPSKSWDETFKAIGATFTIYKNADAVDSAFLPNAVRRKCSEGEIDGPHILLKPPSRNPHVVCLLGIHWALDDTSTQMTLYLHTFGQSECCGVNVWHRGYRLELPHGDGSHSYTHVQPVKTVGWTARTPIPYGEQSVPDSFPSFPLRGHNLTTLCATLAIALHGAGVLTELRAPLRGHRFQKLVNDLLID